MDEKREKRFTITPHPNVELGFKRGDLEYFLTFPKDGINSNTGLVLFISGFGSKADSAYERDKLRPYLADKYNCITAGVNYFGIGNRIETGAELEVDMQFAITISRLYEISLSKFFEDEKINLPLLLKALGEKKITKVDPSCMLKLIITKQEYQSFGFLPAIDHLQVLGEILKAYPVNKNKIIAYGSSYGGYIALLLGKFAPSTFSAIIDNSGFVQADMKYIVGYETLHPEVYQPFCSEDVTFPLASLNPWTVKDKTSQYFFSESDCCIRSLLRKDHIQKSETNYFIFHSKNDSVINIKHKDKFVSILKNKAIPVYYKRVGTEDLDGKVFKNLDHSMNASLRGIFDLAAGNNSLCKKTSITDFDMGNTYTFNCGEKSYVFKFDMQYKLRVEILRNLTDGKKLSL